MDIRYTFQFPAAQSLPTGAQEGGQCNESPICRVRGARAASGPVSGRLLSASRRARKRPRRGREEAEKRPPTTRTHNSSFPWRELAAVTRPDQAVVP